MITNDVRRDLRGGAFPATSVADAVGHRHADAVEVDVSGQLRMLAELEFGRAEADTGHVAVDDEAADALRPVAAGADHGDVDIVRPAARDDALVPVTR